MAPTLSRGTITWDWAVRCCYRLGGLNPVTIEPGDSVIFNSRRIPGNEFAIGNMVNQLIRMGATIIGDHEARVHRSGHAFNGGTEPNAGSVPPKGHCAPARRAAPHGGSRGQGDVQVTSPGGVLAVRRDA